MANIVESETWDTGVYQLETTDPVQGGVDGIDNVPHKALANRTVWLKAQLALKALLGGDNTQIFKAADGLAADDVVTKGQLDTAIASAGKVLQVVDFMETTTLSIGTSSLTSIISAKITPKSATSKIIADITIYSSSNNTNGLYAFLRNGGDLSPSIRYSNQFGTEGFLDADENFNGGSTYTIQPSTFQFADTPNSTSELTYDFAMKTDGTEVVYFGRTYASANYTSIRATIRLMEVGI